jgi:hypothetical protein
MLIPSIECFLYIYRQGTEFYFVCGWSDKKNGMLEFLGSMLKVGSDRPTCRKRAIIEIFQSGCGTLYLFVQVKKVTSVPRSGVIALNPKPIS